MAFPASQELLSGALQLARHAAVRIKQQTQGLRNLSASGDTDRKLYITLQKNLTSVITEWDITAATPGIAQYARDQFSDQALDVVVEFAAMRSAAIQLRLWIFNNLPTGSGGAVLLQTLDLDGRLTGLTVSSAAATQFRVEADLLIATIG